MAPSPKAPKTGSKAAHLHNLANGTAKQSNTEPGDTQEAFWESGLLIVGVAFAFSEVKDAPHILMLDDVENLPWRFGNRPTLSWPLVRNALQESKLGVYEPVASLVKLLLCAACGSSENPRPHLIFNQFLHVTNSLLLMNWLQLLVAKPILRREDQATQRAPRWPALAAAAFWAIHPLRSENVAWISCQPYLLAGSFSLIALTSYERGGFLATMLFFFLACFCKVAAVAVIVPVALRGLALRHGFARWMLHNSCMLALGVFAALAKPRIDNPGSIEMPAVNELGLPIWPDRVLKGAAAVWWILSKEVFPSGLAHRFWLPPTICRKVLKLDNPLYGGGLAAWAATTLLSSVALVVPRKARETLAHCLCPGRKTATSGKQDDKSPSLPWISSMAYFWLAFNAALFPALRVLIHHGDSHVVASVRYTYLPDLVVLAPALALLFSSIAAVVDDGKPRPLRSFCGTFGGAWAAAGLIFWTRVYVSVWQTSDRVYNQALAINPLEAFSAFNLAHFYNKPPGNQAYPGSRKIEAVELYREAAQISRDAGDTFTELKSLINYGVGLSDLEVASRYKEAESSLRRALKVLPEASINSPGFIFKVPYNLANVLGRQKRWPEALEYYQMAGNVANDPDGDRWQALRNAAQVAQMLGRGQLAKQLAKQGLDASSQCQVCRRVLESYK